MIKKIRHKGLRKFYESCSTKGINPKHATRLRLLLARLDASKEPQDMSLPGLDLHQLTGSYDEFWAVSVSGNWRVIFRFEDAAPTDVDYLDYH